MLQPPGRSFSAVRNGPAAIKFWRVFCRSEPQMTALGRIQPHILVE